MPSCVVEEVSYHGAPAYRLSNGLVEAVAVPSLGGRVMSFSLGGRDILFANEAELKLGPPWQVEGRWRNWGGYKMWPAPQARWGGPPDPPGGVLDGGLYRAVAETDPDGRWCSVTMTSPDDRTTGLCFQRTIRLENGVAGARIDQRMTNKSDGPSQWSIWDVTQVPGWDKARGSTFVYFPLHGSKSDPGYILQAGEADNPTWAPNVAPGIMGVRYSGVIGKIGAMAVGNWMAFRTGDLVYAKLFPAAMPEESYPDGGVNVEVWSNPDPPYMEMEILGPLADLRPGDSAQHNQQWIAAVVSDGPVVAVSADAVACGPITLAGEGGLTRLSGYVGVARRTLVSILATGPSGGWTVLAQAAAEPGAPVDLASLALPASADLNGASAPTADLMLTVCTGDEGDYSLLAVIEPSGSDRK